MKKILSNFGDSVLSRESMRKITGGDEVICERCKDDNSYLCSKFIGGTCKCFKSGLGGECQTHTTT